MVGSVVIFIVVVIFVLLVVGYGLWHFRSHTHSSDENAECCINRQRENAPGDLHSMIAPQTSTRD